MKAKIKTWDKMVEEYGIVENWAPGVYIAVPGSYFQDMEDLVPEDRVIDISMTGYGSVTMEDDWVITPEMIEYVMDDEGNQQDPENAFKLLEISFMGHGYQI